MIKTAPREKSGGGFLVNCFLRWFSTLEVIGAVLGGLRGCDRNGLGFLGGRFFAGVDRRLEEAGFVDDAGEMLDEVFTGDFFGFRDADEWNMRTFEEFFHVFGVAARIGFVVVAFVIELDGADGTQSAFVTEDEVDGFVLDKTISGIAILETNFMAEEGRNTDVGDDIKFFSEKVVK